MSNAGNFYRSDRMIASARDPWVSVGLIAQNVFCRRAGIIHHETPREDDDDEVYRAGRGLRRIFYSFREIGRAIKKTIISLVVTFLLMIVVYFIDGSTFITHIKPHSTVVLLQLGSLVLDLIGVIFLFVYSMYLLALIWIYFWAKVRAPKMPDPNSSESQQINWWSLLNAGFQPITPQDMYRDEQWHLAGCPWRILVKGNLRIPVFRKRFSDGPVGKKLFPQHYARMAAYCHLIEKSERASSPYGIILFGKTPKGVTVPYQRREKGTLRKSILDTRATLTSIGSNFVPSMPANLEQCKKCPHSKRDRLTGASPCGMRFGWIPPNYRDDYYRRY
jgi:hypothetical protein